MLRNFFKTAWRNLTNNKSSSIINIGGLSAGMAVAMLIGLWIYDEVSFNKNFPHHARIAQVMQHVANNGEIQTWRAVPFPLAEELRKNYGSDFSQVVMCTNRNDYILSYNDKKLKESGSFFEKGVADLFSLNMLRGSRHSLDDPATILLSASAAKAFFGTDDPVNKILKIDQFPGVKVTGVYADFPFNSTFAALDFIANWDFMYANTEWIRTITDPWRPNAFLIFVRVNDNADMENLSLKIKDAKLKKVNPQLAKKKPELFLQPMDNWHLYSEFKDGLNIGGAIRYVWMFGVIGIFVLLLACINFMNLSTARSEKRAKEVGIRKSVGSLRSQLIIQFFSESFLTVFFAFALSLLFVRLAIPFFNQVSAKQIIIPWRNPVFWSGSLIFMLITALIAGSYPAFYLSSFNAVRVLKGSFKAGRFAMLPRKILVILQFTVSVTLIISTIIVYRQILFAKNRAVGYSRDGLVSIPLLNPSIHNHFDAVKTELIKTGAVLSIAESGSPTTGVWNGTSGLSWRGKDPNLSVDFGNVGVSFDYGSTVGWKIKEGRGFSKDFATDTSALVLNQAAIRFMGLKNPVGQQVTWWGQPLTIIGVVDNLVMESPYEEPRPTIFNLSNDPGNFVLVRINPLETAGVAITKIAAVFKKFNTEQPFEYKFVDEDYAKKFGDEERIGTLAGFFALLAIAISCLGLFGLTSFVAEQRKKEIGVRRVLGASVLHVWELLSRDFVMLVFISFLIAIPLAYYFMNQWLKHYQYRASMSWWVFALAAALALILTLVTVSFQAIRAALAKPANSLRTD
jgi:putative ABC transport system permease protein